MDILGSPGRNLIAIILFVLGVFAAGTLAYVGAGWDLEDAFYMVLLTVYTVGYEEVHPVNTPYLHFVTAGIMVLGCTGMILFSSALVQFLTASQLQKIFGVNRVQNLVDKMTNHTILVGFGRIGVQLAQELKTGGAPFVILDKDEKRMLEARNLGYLCLACDAADEGALRSAGINRAHTLATVLPNDAANVFITLSARALNPDIEIIARGEAPSTERKLFQAGADQVVLPTHIGAERIAEIILFPETSRFLRSSDNMKDMERSLRGLGLDMQVIIAPEGGKMTGLTIEEIETRAGGAFFIVQINHRQGDPITNPDRSAVVHAGDGLVVVGRGGQAVRALFDLPPEKAKTSV